MFLDTNTCHSIFVLKHSLIQYLFDTPEFENHFVLHQTQTHTPDMET